MYWQKRFDRENPDIELEEKIHEIHKRNKDYGYRRMCGELRNQGYIVNKKKVQRIMQKYNLQVMSFTRKSRKYSSYKGRIGTVAPNRIKRRFNTHIPHQKITTDTTEFKYYEVDSKGKMTMHKLYLDPFMDMFNGEIISYNLSRSPNIEQIYDMLDKAFAKFDNLDGLIIHSDQGWQYQHYGYRQRLTQNHVLQSMSRKGNCLDNAMAENFFGIMKPELLYAEKFKSAEDFIKALDEYIDYYNNKRIKSRLKGKSPVQYRTLSI